MKYCSKCGSENDAEVKFCSKCGNSFENEVSENKNVVSKNKEGLGVASLVIGIIALVLSFTCIFFIPFFIIFPLALVGLILGIVNKVKKGRKFAGIILNAFALLISIVTCILFFVVVGLTVDEATTEGTDLNKFINRFYNELERETSDNYVEGSYNCKSYSGSGESNDYIVHFDLYKDNTFVWGKYNDTNNNYVKGTYTFKDLDKKNASGEYSYYNIKLDGEEYYVNSVKQDQKYASEYEFGITAVNRKKQGILMNVRTYNMYYCYEE